MNKKFVGFMVLFVGLLIIVFSAFQANSAMASPALGVGQCFGEESDAKDENGSDGWHIYAPEGYVFDAAKVKAGANCYGNGSMYQITGIGTDHVTAIMLCTEGPDCPGISHLEGMWEEVPDTPTPVPPTPTPTNTPEDPTATPTNTPEDPTATPTNTPEGPTATPTNTPEDPTATPTPKDKDPGPGDTTVLPSIALAILGIGLVFIGTRKMIIN